MNSFPSFPTGRAVDTEHLRQRVQGSRRVGKGDCSLGCAEVLAIAEELDESRRMAVQIMRVLSSKGLIVTQEKE